MASGRRLLLAAAPRRLVGEVDAGRPGGLAGLSLPLDPPPLLQFPPPAPAGRGAGCGLGLQRSL